MIDQPWTTGGAPADIDSYGPASTKTAATPERRTGQRISSGVPTGMSRAKRLMSRL